MKVVEVGFEDLDLHDEKVRRDEVAEEDAV